MAKIIAAIEIAIEQDDGSAKLLKAELAVEGENSYVVSVVNPDGSKEKAAVQGESDSPATAWLVQKLKTLVDQFDPQTTTVKVVSDPCNLLPKTVYRCANPRCRAKLFESWGPAPGIRIVCRKCKTLGIQQAE